MCHWEVGNILAKKKRHRSTKDPSLCRKSPWEPLLRLQLSTSNILKPVSDLSQHQHVTKNRFLWAAHQFYDHLSSPVFLSVSHHTSLFFPPVFFPFVLFPTVLSHGFFSQFFSQCFPHILTPSHPSQHCPTPSRPYLSKVLCRLFCVFAWRSASAVKLLVAKSLKCPWNLLFISEDTTPTKKIFFLLLSLYIYLSIYLSLSRSHLLNKRKNVFAFVCCI